MPVHLIIGPHQSGKSRRLWERLRAEPPGAAVLVRPEPGIPHDLARQVHAWFGPCLLPQVVSLAEFVERLAAATEGDRAPVSAAAAAHALRAWCREGLRGAPWRSIATAHATAVEVADACLRLDDHLVADADLKVAGDEARRRGDGQLADALTGLARARRRLADGRHARPTPGVRLRALAATAPAPPWSAIYLDDFTSLTPAELRLLAALEPRRVVATAVADARLGPGAPAERLVAAFPFAEIERLPRIDARSGHAPSARDALEALLIPERAIAGAGAVDRYRYRDPVHAGRAIAAWLRRGGVAPGDATCYVRVADHEALALADALAAAGVAVRGTFQVPLASTAAGGLLAALGRWCAEPSWEALLAVCERLDLAGVADGVAPQRLADLRLPWASLPAAEALAKLERVARDGRLDGWAWDEPDSARPRLAALRAWLAGWAARLTVDGAWAERFEAGVAALGLEGSGAAVVRRLRELEAMAPVGERELAEALAIEPSRVERGTGAADELAIADAVRGRSWQRPVVILHGLEHGRWPRQAVAGPVLGGERRRTMSATLGRDIFDEDGRAAGEIAALLAAAARASSLIVLGIPCGEREPAAWLATICGQLGWDLEALRERPDGEAAPGAPLGPADSQGAHERALWQPRRRPSFRFAVPPAWPPALRPGDLNAVADDAFAIVCDRLRLRPAWGDESALRAGLELHALLARLTAEPPAAWPTALEPLLAAWIGDSPDPIEAAARRRLAAHVREAMAQEAGGLPGGTVAEAEVPVAVPLSVPGFGELQLRGRIDRIDRLPHGPVRIVDYKRGRGDDYKAAVGDGSEGQLLAYCIGLQAGGAVIESAYYLALRDGARPGYQSSLSGRPRAGQAPMADLPLRAAALAEAVARLAQGEAAARPDGLCARRGYAPIARLDEARLDLSAEDAEDGA